MAIRVRAQLRKWFGRGMYPTAEQFSDLFDSFFHKTEDKIPMSGVEGLTDQLNGKYSTAEGRELEKKVQKVTTDLSAHVASSEKAFNEVQNDIEALDGRLDDEIERAESEEAAIRRELAAGDAATLQSANEHTDTAVAEEASTRENGDHTTLQSSKDYADKIIAEMVDGSPSALNTFKKLAAALGNDPNFATTVATQIGRKVDKIAGKGLSTEDYTSEEKAKLAGISSGANNYQHPATHPASMITQDTTHRFVTDAEKTAWNQACGQSSGSPLHDLFIAAGAVWDDSTKSWTVGTYTGLDNEQMAAVYAQTNNALCSDRWSMVLQKRTAPVNLPPTILAFALDSYISLENATEAFRESLFEEINLVPLSSNSYIHFPDNTTGVFMRCSQLRRINGIMIPGNGLITRWFTQCYALEKFDLYNLQSPLVLSSCSNITRDTLYNLVDRALRGSGITITVHADVYAKLTDSANASWYAINTLAMSKKISFATI